MIRALLQTRLKKVMFLKLTIDKIVKTNFLSF